MVVAPPTGDVVVVAPGPGSVVVDAPGGNVVVVGERAEPQQTTVPVFRQFWRQQDLMFRLQLRFARRRQRAAWLGVHSDRRGSSSMQLGIVSLHSWRHRLQIGAPGIASTGAAVAARSAIARTGARSAAGAAMPPCARHVPGGRWLHDLSVVRMRRAEGSRGPPGRRRRRAKKTAESSSCHSRDVPVRFCPRA